jgi:peptide/nickel transport system substrate-binding protein
MVVDVNSVINTLLKGMGVPTAGPFREIGPQANPNLKPLPYDPDGAKKLLATAGWRPGSDGVLARDGVKFEFDLTVGAGSPMVDRLATYLKNQFENAGIRMRITPWEFAVMQKRIDDRDFDAVFMSWMGSGPEDDPSQIWHSKSIENKGSNFIGFNNPESDRLLDEARTTMDKQKRMELWHKWEALIVEEQPYTFVYSRPDRMFVNGRFKNTEPYKLDVYPYDWYVPAAAQKYK